MIGWIKKLSTSTPATLAAITLVSVLGIALSVAFGNLHVSGGIALYFVIWWTLIFVVLPFGIRSQQESGQVVAGSEPGAPAAPALREKALWTTLISSPVLVFVSGVLPLSGL